MLALPAAFCLFSVIGIAPPVRSTIVLFEARCIVCHETMAVLMLKRKNKNRGKATIVEIRKNREKVNDAKTVTIATIL